MGAIDGKAECYHLNDLPSSVEKQVISYIWLAMFRLSAADIISRIAYRVGIRFVLLPRIGLNQPKQLHLALEKRIQGVECLEERTKR